MTDSDLSSKIEKLAGSITVLKSKIEYLIDLVEKGEGK